MIRFRIGQSWKRESGGSPVDSFGLELDGVNLLPEASEEPLSQVVPALVEALHALVTQGESLAQVSLQEAHLELVFRRLDAEVEVQVVSLGRPARLQRAGVRVDLRELGEAAAKIGRALVRDLPGADWKKMLQRVEALEGAAPVPPRGHGRETGFSCRLGAKGFGAFGLQLWDPDDLLTRFDKRGHGALGSLLCAGEAFVELPGVRWQAQGPPFLFALELSRQAEQLAHAIELKEPSFAFRPGGLEPELRLDLQDSDLPLTVLRSMFELGIWLAFAIGARNKAQAKNPYVEELSARCRDGLSHLRAPVSPLEQQGPPSSMRKHPASQSPLETAGRLRRLRFEPLWEKQNLGGGSEEPGKLLLGAHGPTFVSDAMACGVSPRGKLLFRRVGTRGVAASKDGRVLVAFDDRVMGFVGAEPCARWVRDHDGLPVDPVMIRKEGLWLLTSEHRAALAFHEYTGRELWRSAPPRTLRAFLSVQSHRALLATDGGFLFGLDLVDGQIRYRMRAALPFLGAPLPWGRKMVATLGRSERVAIFTADAHSGKVQQEHEVSLTLPSAPLASGTRTYLAGEQDGDGVLLCYGAHGKLVFQRKLHLGPGPYQLLPVQRSVLAVGQSGAATLVSSDGQVQWHVGSSGEPLAVAVQPAYARGVVILPGEKVRAVDPQGGQLLAEVEASPGLCDLKVDSRLNLYLLDDGGTLKAYKLATHLAVL